MASDRLAPANVEAEEAVLGALLINPAAIHRVATRLRVEDFSRPAHARIYEAILNVYGRQQVVDPVTVKTELERLGVLEEVGGQAYLIQLQTRTWTSAHAEHYASLVEHAALRRRLIGAGTQIADLAYREAGLSPAELIDRAEALLFQVSDSQTHRDLLPIVQVIHEYHEKLERLGEGRDDDGSIKTGFKALDFALGGLRGSDLVIVAGRPGTGKTSWLLTVAAQVASTGRTVAIFSLEMSAEQLLERLIAARTQIPAREFRRGRLGSPADFPLVVRAIGKLAELPLYIDDTAGLTPFEMRTKARRLHTEHGVDLICLDYLQLMNAGRSLENRVQEISLISRSLKSLARELNVPIIAASQLSRAVERRTDKAPLLSDLRDSGSIEQDADIVIFLHHDAQMSGPNENESVCRLHIAKHRHGPVCAVDLCFVKHQTQFRDVPLGPPDLEVPF